MLDQIKSKVQRILAENFSVRLGKNGEWIVDFGPTVVFVEVESFTIGEDEVGLVVFQVPLIHGVPLSNELMNWIIFDGHDYRVGHVCAYRETTTDHVFLTMEHSVYGIDVDESELCHTVGVLAVSCDDLDAKLHQRFGGKMFGSDE